LVSKKRKDEVVASSCNDNYDKKRFFSGVGRVNLR